MQRGLTHGAENGARSVLAGNVERIDGNAEKRQAKFAFRLFFKDVTTAPAAGVAGRSASFGRKGALRPSAGGGGLRSFRLRCADTALWRWSGARAQRCGRPPGREGRVAWGSMRKTDAGRKASGVLLRLRAARVGRKVPGRLRQGLVWENHFPKRQGLRALPFYFTRFCARKSLQGCHLKDAKQRRTVRAETSLQGPQT